MEKLSGFLDGDFLYSKDEFNRYFENLFKNGVSIDDDGIMTLESYVSGSNIKVKSGFAIIKGFYLYNDAEKTFLITKDNTYNRIDRIVLRLNLSSKTVSIEHKQGTASSNPVPPSLQRDNLIHELSLYKVNVTLSGSLSLKDERFDNDLCGAIRPKNLTEYEDMINTFTSQFEAWFESQQAKGWRNIFIQEGEPLESVVGSIWIKKLI